MPMAGGSGVLQDSPAPPAFPPESAGADPMALLLALKQLAGVKAPTPEPMYRPGYKPPKKPGYDEVWSTAQNLYDNARQWRALISMTLMWTRQKMTGIFPEDMNERLNGLQEEYISSALSDERNLMIALGADQELSLRKRPLKEDDRGYAQRLEDAAIWFRAKERLHHAERGNRPLELDEWAQLIDYGMYVSRDTLWPENPGCPVRSTLIDPAQVHPLFNVYGLDRVYRVYSDTAAELTASYGDFAPSVLKQIEDTLGSVTDTTEFEVTEYWDTWRRCVLVNSVPLVPMTEHKYGEVPWTVAYGGYGEPMFTRTPGQVSVRRINGGTFSIEGSRGDDRIFKATPFIYYRIKNHELKEAVGARLVTAMKKGVNPPVIRYRDDDAGQQDLPELYTGPGAQNEAQLGREKIEPLPPMDLSVLDRTMALISTDEERAAPPPQMRGGLGGTSNVTGVAQGQAASAGDYLLTPAVAAYTMAQMRRYPRIFRLLGNFGDDIAYGNGRSSPLMIPVSRRSVSGGEPGYEFNREIIDRVGSDIEVKITKIDPSKWAALVAGAKPAIDLGALKRSELREMLVGDADFDRHLEEWSEENAVFGMQQLPEFQKMNVMAQITDLIKENEGRPEIQAMYRNMLQMWQQSAMQPPAPPPGQGPPPGGQLPQQPGMPNPATSAGTSYPQLGQGPGLNGGQVGAPMQGTDVGP